MWKHLTRVSVWMWCHSQRSMGFWSDRNIVKEVYMGMIFSNSLTSTTSEIIDSQKHQRTKHWITGAHKLTGMQIFTLSHQKQSQKIFNKPNMAFSVSITIIGVPLLQQNMTPCGEMLKFAFVYSTHAHTPSLTAVRGIDTEFGIY